MQSRGIRGERSETVVTAMTAPRAPRDDAGSASYLAVDMVFLGHAKARIQYTPAKQCLSIARGQAPVVTPPWSLDAPMKEATGYDQYFEHRKQLLMTLAVR